MFLWVLYNTRTLTTNIPGWTLAGQQIYGNELGLDVYEKRAAATEPANYNGTIAGGVLWTAGIAAYSGVSRIAARLGQIEEYGRRDFSIQPLLSLTRNTKTVAIAAQGSPTLWGAPTGWNLQATTRSGDSVRSDISSALLDLDRPEPGVLPVSTAIARVPGSALVVAVQNGVVQDRDASLIPMMALQELGINDVLIISQDTLLADMQSAANASDVVLALGEVSSPNVNFKLLPVEVGVCCFETALYDEMKISETPIDTATTDSITITDTSHILAAGLEGTVKAISPATYLRAIGTLGSSQVEPVAVHPDTQEAIIFGMEKDAQRFDGTPNPARRMGFGIHEATTNWSDDTKKLAKAAIDYCIRYGPSPQILIQFVLEEEINIDYGVDARYRAPALLSLTPYYRSDFAVLPNVPSDRRQDFERALVKGTRNTVYSPDQLMQLFSECYFWDGIGQAAEGSGITRIDSWGLDRPLTSSQPADRPIQSAEGAVFDGSDDFFDGNAVPILTDWNDFSISFAARLTAGTLFAQYDHVATDNKGVIIRIQESDGILQGNAISVSFDNPIPNEFKIYSVHRIGNQFVISQRGDATDQTSSGVLPVGKDSPPLYPNTGFIVGARTQGATYNQNLTDYLNGTIKGIILHPTKGEHIHVIRNFMISFYLG